MQRTTGSAAVVILTTIITVGDLRSVNVANATARANRAQTKTPAAPGERDACALLTKQDAAAALAEAVTGPNHHPVAPRSRRVQPLRAVNTQGPAFTRSI